MIRVGRTKGSREVSTDERVGVVENARKIADLAAAEGIKIAFEYHSNTLTDTPAHAAAAGGSGS